MRRRSRRKVSSRKNEDCGTGALDKLPAGEFVFLNGGFHCDSLTCRNFERQPSIKACEPMLHEGECIVRVLVYLNNRRNQSNARLIAKSMDRSGGGGLDSI